LGQDHGCGGVSSVAACCIHKDLDGLVEPAGDDYWPFGERVWPNGLSPATPPIRTLWGTNRIPQKGALTEEVAHVNTHFPLFRIAFAAAAAVFIFLMVHAALEGVSGTADVLAGLQ
jgi:hypothetical protein